MKSVELFTELVQDSKGQDFYEYAKDNLEFAKQHKVSEEFLINYFKDCEGSLTIRCFDVFELLNCPCYRSLVS